jgi:polyisoprenoid-binding protein YceI
MLNLLLTTLALSATPAVAPADSAAVFVIDKSHSELTFRIRHFMSRVSGTFTDWQGTVTGEPPAWTAGSADIVIQTASINTGNDRRDADLKSPNFFDATVNPQITFKSTSVTIAGTGLTLAGDLTMHGVTKPVTLKGEYLGAMSLSGGRQRVGFHVSTTINRLDYGVVWNKAIEGGGVMLGDDVDIDISIEAITKQ